MAIDWYSITLVALQNLWQGFLGFIPNLIGAIIVFVIGWFIAIAIGKLVAEILNRLKFNQIFETVSWKKALEKAELKINVSEFIGAIAKWVLIIVFLKIAVGILGWTDFSLLLGQLIAYLPNVVVAALIFVVAVIVADILAKVVVVTVESAKFAYSHLAGEIVRWSIWIFAALVILHQLGIGKPLIETLFMGLVAILVIALGLAFGLGGKDVAAGILENLRKRLKG